MKKAPPSAAVMAMLRDLSRQTGLGAMYFDLARRQISTTGTLPPFCRWCLDDPRAAARCRAVYEEATTHALSAAEPFYHVCWAGLLYVVVAVAPFAHCRGCVAVSGFRAADDREPWLPQDDSLSRLAPRGGKGPGPLLAAAPVITADRLRGIGAYLLDACFASGLNSAIHFQKQQSIYLQQRAIAEQAQQIKPGRRQAVSLLRRAARLTAQSADLQPDQLRRQCAAYLAEVLQDCAWNMMRLKAHLRVPLAMLSRDALLRGADWHGVTGEELRQAARLDQCQTIEDVCHFFQEILLSVAGQARASQSQPALSQRVLAWLETNYSRPATLVEAARAVGASAPSIIKHIKRDTGKTFHATLAEIRVAEARRLLATTALDLSEIAQQCGYCDQSHFTRQFRQDVNLTPGQFRKLMIVTEAEVLK